MARPITLPYARSWLGTDYAPPGSGSIAIAAPSPLSWVGIRTWNQLIYPTMRTTEPLAGIFLMAIATNTLTADSSGLCSSQGPLPRWLGQGVLFGPGTAFRTATRKILERNVLALTSYEGLK